MTHWERLTTHPTRQIAGGPPFFRTFRTAGGWWPHCTSQRPGALARLNEQRVVPGHLGGVAPRRGRRCVARERAPPSGSPLQRRRLVQRGAREPRQRTSARRHVDSSRGVYTQKCCRVITANARGESDHDPRRGRRGAGRHTPSTATRRVSSFAGPAPPTWSCRTMRSTVRAARRSMVQG